MNVKPVLAAFDSIKLLVLGFAVFFAFSAAGSTPSFAEEAYIVDVVRSGPQDRVMISATLKGAMTKEIRDNIESGAPVIFTYMVKLRKVRTLVWDETIREVAVKKLVKYDPLRKVYLTWEKKGSNQDEIGFEEELVAMEYKDKEDASPAPPASTTSSAKDAPLPPQEPTPLKDRDAMEKWMTHLENVDLAASSDLRNTGRHYASVKCEMKPIKLLPPFNYILFFVSLWDFDTKWSDSTFFAINGSSEPSKKPE